MMWKENAIKIIYLCVAVLFEVILMFASTMYVSVFSFSYVLVVLATGFSIYHIIRQIWPYEITEASCEETPSLNIGLFLSAAIQKFRKTGGHHGNII